VNGPALRAQRGGEQLGERAFTGQQGDRIGPIGALQAIR